MPGKYQSSHPGQKTPLDQPQLHELLKWHKWRLKGNWQHGRLTRTLEVSGEGQDRLVLFRTLARKGKGHETLRAECWNEWQQQMWFWLKKGNAVRNVTEQEYTDAGRQRQANRVAHEIKEKAEIMNRAIRREKEQLREEMRRRDFSAD